MLNKDFDRLYKERILAIKCAHAFAYLLPFFHAYAHTLANARLNVD